MFGKKLLLFVVIAVALPGIAFAEMDTDLRFKFGSSAQADELTVGGITGTGTGKSSSNFQVELIFSPKTQESVGLIFGAGLPRVLSSIQRIRGGIPRYRSLLEDTTP